jgi:hypothetical protein
MSAQPSPASDPQREQSDMAAAAATQDMLAALYTALPYIEDAEHDPAYKPGAVAKVTAQVRAAIAKANGGTL